MKKLLISCIAILVFNACATYKRVENSKITSSNSLELKTLEKRIFLIGNTYNASSKNTLKTITNLKKQLAKNKDKALVLGLGNYFSEEKLINKDSDNTIKDALTPLLNTLKESTNDAIFIPGYRDWNINGLQGLQTQQEIVNEVFGKDSFLPKDGCPIKSHSITENIELIVVDADWFINNWDKEPNFNRNCEINTKKRFFNEFSDRIKKARGKTTIVAISKPMFSNGEYGGYYSFSNNLLPLPILGNIKNMIKRTGGFNSNSLYNKYYTDLRQRLVTLSKQNNTVIFVSGNEENLQYLKEKNNFQIISGSANSTSPVKKTNSTIYANAKQGFACLNIYTDGSSEVQFYTNENEEVDFSAQVYKPYKKNTKTFPVLEQDSIEASIIPTRQVKRSKIFGLFFGKRYRNYYGKKVNSKIVYLDTLYGGLSPIRQGGGNQSVSLHLVDSIGKRYVMRAMRKNSSQYMQSIAFRDVFLQNDLKNTIAEKTLEDFFTGSYPYSIILAEGLSEKVEIPTQSSKVFYIPKQERLDNFNVNFGDKLYVVESHPKKGNYQLGSVAFNGKVISTYDLLNAIEKDESVKIDQNSFIKARLFDMLIGDWDRHQDQWKWLEYKENGNTVYRPLPRDRDQAFSKMGDGFLVKLALFLVPQIRVINNYCGNLKNVKEFNTSPFPLDVAFLPDLNEKDWLEQANYIKNQLTDQAIESVFKKMPKELQDEQLEKIKNYLKERRDNLAKIAKKYYKRVVKYAILKGTNKDDLFHIKILTDKRVAVSIYRNKGGEAKDRFHYKIFNPKETKEIWLYGLDDSDIFKVEGSRSKIKITLIGGQNNDTYIVPKSANIRIYDFKTTTNDISKAKQHATVRLRNQYNRNNYDYRNTYENAFQLYPIIAANQDVGTQLGLLLIESHKKFKGTISHSLNTSFYTATNGLTLVYNGSFPEVIGRYNFNLNANFNTQNYATNFFGFGNETINFQDSIGRNKNRVNMIRYVFNPSFSQKFYNQTSLKFGLNYLNAEVKNSYEDVLETDDVIPNYLYKANTYLSACIGFAYNNKDYDYFPTNGLSFNIEAQYTSNLNKGSKNFAKLLPTLALDYKLVASGKLVFSTKLLGSIILGNGFEFFQASYLGGNLGLRGYRNQRFAGKNSFAQTTDLRWSFNRVKTFIVPMRLGVFGGFDYGRVWLKNDTSKKWHNSIGGGLFLIFAESVTANFSGFSTENGPQYMFSMGFGF